MNINPFKKRVNPLELNPEHQSEPVKEVSQPVKEEPQIVKETYQPVREIRQPVKEVVHVKKEMVSDKVKYTAVMDKDLRVRLKIASAKKNMQFSQFIEEAVAEKMEREGF